LLYLKVFDDVCSELAMAILQFFQVITSSIFTKEKTVSKFHFTSLFRESLTRRRSGGA